jgi:hypothetical protein
VLGGNGGDRLAKSFWILHDGRNYTVQSLSGSSGIGGGDVRWAEDGCPGAGRRVTSGSSGRGFIWSRTSAHIGINAQLPSQREEYGRTLLC